MSNIVGGLLDRLIRMKRGMLGRDNLTKKKIKNIIYLSAAADYRLTIAFLIAKLSTDYRPIIGFFSIEKLLADYRFTTAFSRGKLSADYRYSIVC